eukprot:TRINITY_DN27857_c0_g1_i3.p2 TRINITY_DN27857_c0_g1~~TRINITY_DN27857_c0_g1_i3.p2  ORF type:complete len:144 (-),score=12.40 TRINITY_DN27857_c0_g1_i3:284-715(-)
MQSPWFSGAISVCVPLIFSDGDWRAVDAASSPGTAIGGVVARLEEAQGERVVQCMEGCGTLAYSGYQHPSWNDGVLFRMETKWCFYWAGSGQVPVVFHPLSVREGMSFVQPTLHREAECCENATRPSTEQKPDRRDSAACVTM